MLSKGPHCKRQASAIEWYESPRGLEVKDDPEGFCMPAS